MKRIAIVIALAALIVSNSPAIDVTAANLPADATDYIVENC